MAEKPHQVVHRNPIGEVVCSCGEFFESGTPLFVWREHMTGPQS